MRRRAERGYTTHELMALSGHKTLAEVQRYTDAADKRRLADSGAAKDAAARGQSENIDYTNTAAQLHKHAAKLLKRKE